MDFTSPFLVEQIIAYIGNKRKLLPLIMQAFTKTGLDLSSNLKFLDVFAGSGVVSRFAKSLNFEVFTNDWESYSYVLSHGFLETNKSDLKYLFGSDESFHALIENINSLPSPAEENQYIAKFYAPKHSDVEKADYRTERLFYTKENALAIDKIRNYIEENYPSDSKDKNVLKKRNLLLSVLIYEAATHTNTSGVFKAFHKEFGGHGKDALHRILMPIKLREPVLIDSKNPVHIFQENANELVKKIKGIDIAYLDPPYNQHQYGSNYHILNTIAKWDKIPAPLELNDKGVLKEKAGIRHDWVNTRSDYCYKNEAYQAFSELIENLDARHILISYSTDGIIPFEKMLEICMKRGKLSIVTNEYTTYRGGKQSNKRRNSNIEFILSIDTSKKSDEDTLKEIDNILLRKKMLLLFKQKFSESKLKNLNLDYDGENLKIISKTTGREIKVKTSDFFTLTLSDECDGLSNEELSEIFSLLESCTLQTKEEEIKEILQKAEINEKFSVKFAKMIPSVLKKIAHKKNMNAFYFWFEECKKLQVKNPENYEKIKDKLDEVKKIGEIRFST